MDIEKYKNPTLLFEKLSLVSRYTTQDLSLLLQIAESKIVRVQQGLAQLSEEELKRVVDLYLLCERLHQSGII